MPKKVRGPVPVQLPALVFHAITHKRPELIGEFLKQDLPLKPQEQIGVLNTLRVMLEDYHKLEAELATYKAKSVEDSEDAFVQRLKNMLLTQDLDALSTAIREVLFDTQEGG